MLLGKRYHPPYGSVVHDFGEMVEWRLAGKNRRPRRESCCRATSSSMNLFWSYPRLNPGLHGKKVEKNICSLFQTGLKFRLYFLLNYSGRVFFISFMYPPPPFWVTLCDSAIATSPIIAIYVVSLIPVQMYALSVSWISLAEGTSEIKSLWLGLNIGPVTIISKVKF